jgi:cytochrome P450
VKAVNNDSGYLMGEVLGKCLGLVSGQEWRSLRSVSETAFRHDRAITHLDLIHRRVRTFLEANENLRQGIVDPVEDFEFLPFLIVGDLLYGGLSPDMEYQLRRMASGRKRLFQYVIQGGLARCSWSKYLPTAANRGLAEFRTQWIAFNQDAYRRARERQMIETPIVQLFQAAESGRISAENVYQTLDETLFANLDVTVGAMSWNLVFLAAHPDVQDELYADITAAGAREGERIEQFLQSSSTLLAACISESARLKPLAAFSVPQSAPTERLLDSFVIPAGTNFIVDAYALNLRDEFWGPDRHVYRPRRFQELNPTESRYHLWRFGFGPRQCLGKYVADLIMRTLLTHLIREWTLGFPDREGANSENWKRDMETWITHPMIKLTCERRG